MYKIKARLENSPACVVEFSSSSQFNNDASRRQARVTTTVVRAVVMRFTFNTLPTFSVICLAVVFNNSKLIVYIQFWSSPKLNQTHCVTGANDPIFLVCTIIATALMSMETIINTVMYIIYLPDYKISSNKVIASNSTARTRTVRRTN